MWVNEETKQKVGALPDCLKKRFLTVLGQDDHHRFGVKFSHSEKRGAVYEIHEYTGEWDGSWYTHIVRTQQDFFAPSLLVPLHAYFVKTNLVQELQAAIDEIWKEKG